MYKTTQEHLGDTAKYVIPSASLGWALTEIIVFSFPYLDPISEPILTIITIILNLAIVFVVKRGR